METELVKYGDATTITQQSIATISPKHFFFITYGTFLKKSPLNSPLASKTYGKLTPPAYFP